MESLNASLSRSLLAGALLVAGAFAQSETKPPVAKQPVAKQPVAKQPVAKQPVAKQPVTKQPVTKQPVTKPQTKQGPARQDRKQQRPATKEALFRAFAAIKGLSADYTEDKYLSLLAVPLKSKGKLHFMQPGYLSRIVEAPEKSKLTITKSELRMSAKDTTGKTKEEVIDLRQSDRVRLFVTSLVQVFQGNEKALEQHYQVRYTPKADDRHAWQLELQPRKKPLTQIMKKLVLAGSDKSVTRIELHEPNGDRTITKIVKVNANRTFSSKEQKEIFGVSAKPKTPPVKSKAGAPR